MASAETDYKFRNDKGALAKLESMLNSKERSDTLFIVNDTHYHVLSHLVSAHSPVLEDIISEHFTHCEDREIKIRNVRNEESFHFLLKFMYGVEMNFTQTHMTVICEALSLAEKYEVGEFFNELKTYITSTPARCQIDTVVTLLNTARKLNQTDLYEEAKAYACQNTEQLVKHESFVQLQYEVLVDLLKSDWFCAKEIEILKGVLTWHDDMDSKKSKENVDGTIEHGTDNGFEDAWDPYTFVREVDLEDCIDTKSEDNKTNSSTNDLIAMENNCSDSSNTDNPNLSSKPNGCAELVKSFKENVLKSLLSHIRIGNILTLEHLKTLETHPFIKYKDFVTDYKLFSQSTEPRKKLSVPITGDQTQVAVEPVKQTQVAVQPIKLDPAALHNKFFVKTRYFQIKRLSLNTFYDSEEGFTVGGLEFRITLKETSSGEKSVDALFDVSMKCTSDKDTNWRCYTSLNLFIVKKCLLTCKKNNCSVNSLYIPVTMSSYREFIFTKQDPLQYMGRLNLKLDNQSEYCHYVYENTTIKICVQFATICITELPEEQ